MDAMVKDTREVTGRPERRRFTAEYKLRIVQEADACRSREEIGALLRREGLYSSLLANWRQSARSGALSSLKQKRGRKPQSDPKNDALEALQRENRRLQMELRRAEAIIEVQKKVSEILGVQLPDEKDGPT